MLLARHVERFNEGVQTNDFAPMIEQFADEAELSFEGVPVGPFLGRPAIAAAYREQPRTTRSRSSVRGSAPTAPSSPTTRGAPRRPAGRESCGLLRPATARSRAWW